MHEGPIHFDVRRLLKFWAGSLGYEQDQKVHRISPQQMRMINGIVHSSLNDKDDAARAAAIQALSAMGGGSDLGLLEEIANNDPANNDPKIGISARYAAEDLKKKLAAKTARKRDHGTLP
jgi:hypothetical protein